MNLKGDTLYRRQIGVTLGASLGLTYGLVSQSINAIVLPHVPLYQPPLGWIGNILLWSLIGALLGLVTTLPAETVIGALYGGATGAFLLTILTLSGGGSDQGTWTGKMIGVIFLFLPLAGAITPLAALFRWVVNKSVEGRRDSIPIWARLRLPMLLIILVGALGIFSRLPPYARSMVTQMDKMLQIGLQCTRDPIARTATTSSGGRFPESRQRPISSGMAKSQHQPLCHPTPYVRPPLGGICCHCPL